MSNLRRIKRDPMRFEVFEAFSAALGGKRINQEDALNDFLKNARDSVSSSLENDTFLHGQRTQNLFENVIVSLGKVKLIWEEDAGGGWYDGPDLHIPDFFVALTNGDRMLIEVKNYHGIHGPYKLRSSYWKGLRRYGELRGAPVYLALYWSRWNLWTVVPIDLMQLEDKKRVLSMGDAMKANIMERFGDVMIATTPPLALHLIVDKTKPRSVEGDQASFTIGDVKIFCGNNEVMEEFEKGLAWTFMWFGKWDSENTYLEYDSDKLPDRVIFECSVSEDNPDQDFEMLGSLSSMYSSSFRLATGEHEGKLTSIEVPVKPGQFGNLIPDDYKGQQLPIWRFRIKPSLVIGENGSPSEVEP